MGKPNLQRQPAPAPAADLDAELAAIATMDVHQLRERWRLERGGEPPAALSKDLIARALAYQLQEAQFGGLGPHTRKLLASYCEGSRTPVRHIKVGSIIIREHKGEIHEVMVVPGGFCWRGEIYSSLSTIARKITGTSWNGPRFFGLRSATEPTEASEPIATAAKASPTTPLARSRSIVARSALPQRGDAR